MESSSLGCQVCLTKFNRVSDFKKHVTSTAHRQKMEEIFKKDTLMSPGFFPRIVFMDPLAKRVIKRPIVGLSLLTLCFSPEAWTSYYLCHVCEEKCPMNKILCHLSSGDHCCNYFNYRDPDVLSFSWMPCRDMRTILRPQSTKGDNETGSGTLQILDLPKNLIEKLGKSTYSEVMQTLSANDKLLKLFEATKPKRTTIQTYRRDINRKHPLLGLQHLVECICVGSTEKTYYLCTLCNLTVAARAVVKHVLSFDHIYCYFKAQHLSSLVSKDCYKDQNSITSMMLDFAKQTEKIHGTANTDMKQVSLDPAEFTSVNFTSYAEALKKLESITKERKESSLIIKPENKLECCTVSAGSVAPSYKLRCQDCSIIFETQSKYLKHLSDLEHKQMLKELFKKAEKADDHDQAAREPILGLYRYLQESLKQNKVVIGVSLVVACVSTQFQAEPIYVCSACQDCFRESSIRQHFQSQKHLICTLLHQNPSQLPFGWKNHLDVKVLMSMAQEDEKERGPHQMMLEVLDIPYQIFKSLIPPSYSKVMDRLEPPHTLLKQEGRRDKLKQNERFPLLGKQFLVMHDICVRWHQSTEVGFLCLLCKRRLSDSECQAHVFSWEHVATFLDRFHPGSVSSSTDSESLLDLAKQAAHIHPVSNIQVIKLDWPIWAPCTYNRAISILGSAKLRHGGGKLEPPIRPSTKLSPRETLKEMEKDHVRDNNQNNSRMVKGCENETGQKSTDKNEDTPKQFSVELGSEIINKCCVESEENVEKRPYKQPPTPSDKESEQRREVFSKTSPDEIKNAGRETCPLLTEEEKLEEPTLREPSGEIPESCQNTEVDDGAETGKEKSKSANDVLTQLKNYTHKELERKRPISLSEKSPEDACSDEVVERERGHKRQRLTAKVDTSCEEPPKMPRGGQKCVTADKGESGEQSHETAKEKALSKENHQQVAQLWQYVKTKSREPVVGLNALLECCCDQQDPIYLCECCSLKIPEKNIVSHVTGFDHQKMYLVGLQKLSPTTEEHQRSKIRQMAAFFEQDMGYGEAEVVDLDEEIYNKISKQNFNSAIQTVKALQAQVEGSSRPLSCSDLSLIQPVQASVTFHAHHEVSSKMENIQVVEIDNDSEDSEVQPAPVTEPMSAMTKTPSITTEVSPESNTDINMSHIKAHESDDNANICQTLSRGREDESCLYLSKIGTNTPNLHSDSTGNNSKVKIAPNTTVEPFTPIITSKMVGTSQTAVLSDSTVTTPCESLTVISKCADESFSRTAHAAKLPATVSKLTATTSSSTTATTELRETAYKCVSATSGAAAGTTTQYEVNSNSRTNTRSTACTSSCITTAAKCRETPNKCLATTSSATASTTKLTATTTIFTATASICTAASSKLIGDTSTSSVTISNTTPTRKPVTVPKPLESRAGAASRVTATSCKAAPTSQTGSTVVLQVTCRTTPSETASKIRVQPQATVRNAATSTTAKRSVKCETTELSAKTVNTKDAMGANADVASNIHKNNSPAAPHLTTTMSARSEYKNPPMEPSHTSTPKTKPSKHLPEVGLNQLIIVSCEGRRQVYCQLCSIRMKSSSHLFNFDHQYNYVKMKYPRWTAELPELKSKLEKTVAHLAEVEKGVETQKIMVENDRYNELAALPMDQAIEILKAMVRQRDSQVPSSSTAEPAEALRQQVASSGPCEVSSTDNGMSTPQDDMPGPSIKNEPEKEIKQELPTLLFEVPVTVKQEKLEPYEKTRVDVEETPSVKQEKPYDWAHPLDTNSQSAGTFQLTPHTHQMTLEKRQQQEKIDPGIQDTEKISALKSFRPDLLSSAALVNKEQQNQSTPGLKAELVPKCPGCSPGLGQHSASQVPPRIFTGERTQDCSNLLAYLRVEGLDNEPIIGLSSMWECQGKHSNSFFLCASCMKTLSKNEIYQHVVSPDHQLTYMLRQYPHFMHFWQDKGLPQQMKLVLLKEIAQIVSQRERFNKMDVESLLLEDELYEYVQTAQFSEALKMVQNIKKRQKLSFFFPPIHTPQQRGQQLVNHVNDSPPVEALEIDERSGNGTRQKTKKHLEETAMAGDFCTVSPKTTRTLPVFPRDKCLLSRKRPADESVETLVRPCSSGPQLKDPMPAKCTCSLLQQH